MTDIFAQYIFLGDFDDYVRVIAPDYGEETKQLQVSTCLACMLFTQ